MLIPRAVLIASGPFGPDQSAERVSESIARGLRAGGLPDPDLCPLPAEEHDGQGMPEMLDAVGFDSRMRAARAVIVGTERLDERTLVASFAFEIATRARQSGVPAYAVTATNLLDAFDARILDLQVILQARSPRALAAAGRKLATRL
jgi:glycerate kinase